MLRFASILFVVVWLCPSVLFGQRDIPDNLPKFDNKKIHFGFQLGASSNGFALDHNITKTDSLIKLETGTQPGLVIHILSELHMGPHFGLRFTPGIAFAARDLVYDFKTPKGIVQEVKTIESTFIEAPLLFKYRSARVNNFAQYVIVGGSYSFDLASQEFTDNSVDEAGKTIVKIKRSNYNLEIGTGFDFFLEYFKFSPELKFVYGLNNGIVSESTIYATPVSELRTRIFVFALNFEG